MKNFTEELAKVSDAIQHLDITILEALSQVFKMNRELIDRLLYSTHDELSAEEKKQLDQLTANPNIGELEEIFDTFEEIKNAFSNQAVSIELLQKLDPAHRPIGQEIALADAVLRRNCTPKQIQEWEDQGKPRYIEALVLATLYPFIANQRRQLELFTSTSPLPPSKQS